MNNQLVTVSQINTDLAVRLENDGVKELLPEHVSLKAFAKSAAIAIFNNSQLVNAEKDSVISSLVLAARDGLICDGREAALVPFNKKNSQTNAWEVHAQYMPMVDGVLKRIRQSGQVQVVDSKAVFENDGFEFWSDETGDHFKHVPNLGVDKASAGELVAVIAYAVMNDGSRHVSLLRRWEIDRARDASKTGHKDGSPWSKYFDRMACKTGLHRIARRLPNSSEILEMLERGDLKEWDNTEEREERVIKDINSNSSVADALMGGKSPQLQSEDTMAASTFSLMKDQLKAANSGSDLSEVGKAINELKEAKKLKVNELSELHSLYVEKRKLLKAKAEAAQNASNNAN